MEQWNCHQEHGKVVTGDFAYRAKLFIKYASVLQGRFKRASRICGGTNGAPSQSRT